MKRNADQIFNKYCKLLYKISIIMLCSEEDAYDAVQESFLKYLNTKKDFNDESHERAWLTRVNINICKNILRFRRMHPTVYLYKPLGCVSTLWNWMPAGKDITMHYQKVLKMPESIPYLSVGFDVGADFTWMSIMLPNGILIGKPFKIIHSDPQSRELAISKIKEAQEMYSLESRCFLESTGIYHIPLLCFLRDKGFDCAVINPIITKNSTNMNVRKLHNDKFDSKKAAKVGLDASLKASIVPDDAIIDLRNLVRDYYYFKDLQSAIVLKLHAELNLNLF